MHVGRLARVQTAVLIDHVLDDQRRHRVTVLHGVLATVDQLLIVLGPASQTPRQLAYQLHHLRLNGRSFR